MTDIQKRAHWALELFKLKIKQSANYIQGEPKKQKDYEERSEAFNAILEYIGYLAEQVKFARSANQGKPRQTVDEFMLDSLMKEVDVLSGKLRFYSRGEKTLQEVLSAIRISDFEDFDPAA